MVAALNPRPLPGDAGRTDGCRPRPVRPDLPGADWVRRNYPHPGFFEDLDTNIHILFDDTQVLPDPETALDVVLNPGEVEAMRGVGLALDPLIEELGDASDEAYLNSGAWANVVQHAQRALEALLSNEQVPPG